MIELTSEQAKEYKEHEFVCDSLGSNIKPEQVEWKLAYGLPLNPLDNIHLEPGHRIVHAPLYPLETLKFQLDNITVMLEGVIGDEWAQVPLDYIPEIVIKKLTKEAEEMEERVKNFRSLSRPEQIRNLIETYQPGFFNKPVVV